MARYQVPPDPRKPEDSSGRKAQDDGYQEPIPWRWLGMGLVVTLVGIVLAFSLINAFLSREPLPVTPLSPTLVVLTAPAGAPPTSTPMIVTPTSIPTLTPVPTPDVAVAPDEITPGYYVVVANTEGFGVTVRGGPSTNNVAILIAEEGSSMLVLDGPAEGNGYLWWQVQLADGSQGWAAADFLVPAAGPNQ